MKQIKALILSLLAATTALLSGCEEDYMTSHPDEGGINITVDWSMIKREIPSTYHARIISVKSGKTQDFRDLTGTTANLVVEPGDASFYFFNEAANLTVDGTLVKLATSGGSVVPDPGFFFSCSGGIVTERDRDVPLKVTMRQRTGELTLQLAIKPAETAQKIRSINATLEGIASEFDMSSDKPSGSSKLSTAMTVNSFFAVKNMRLLGVVESSTQNLILEIEFTNGNITTVNADISSLLSGFNETMETPQLLSADLIVAESATIENWAKNVEKHYLWVSQTKYDYSSEAFEDTIMIVTDQPSWEFGPDANGYWLNIERIDNGLVISAPENTNKLRVSTITVNAGGESANIVVTQKASASVAYKDLDVVKLQTATVGKGINIIFMGDGYTEKDMAKGSGKYETDMRQAADNFFSIYPYNQYRNYFNLYMIVAVSNEEGISIESQGVTVDTKFECSWAGGGSTAIYVNDDKVIDVLIEVIEDIEELLADDAEIHEWMIIMPINAYIYAGTSWLYYTSNANDPVFAKGIANGFSINLCPVGSMFREIVVHEAGGHGFAKLADEYVYHHYDYIPEEEIAEENYVKAFGWRENIDFYEDIELTTWSGFAGNTKYDMVGTFEGALTYGKGVWRPEKESCMDDDWDYYNAPSRWAQVRRIMSLAGFDYSFEQFLADDEVPATTRSTRRSQLAPLAPPVIKKVNDNFVIKRKK